MIADPATKRLCVSRKSVPKQKGRIPLGELLAAHLASDDVRLAAHGLRLASKPRAPGSKRAVFTWWNRIRSAPARS